MKLYLASKHLKFPKELKALVGKPEGSVNAYLIVNAFDNYPDERRALHIDNLKSSLAATGYTFKSLDLRNYTNNDSTIEEILRDADLLWVSGGNVFYLRYLLEITKLGSALKRLTEEGLVYAGDSAGAAVLGPDLHGLDMLDDPKEAPEIIYQGLHITSFMTLPHWGNERYAAEIGEAKEVLEKYNNEVITISDDQAIVVNGDELRVVG